MIYEAQLVTGVFVKIEFALGMRAFLDDLDRGVWFRDTAGWYVNPRNILLVQSDEDDAE